MSTYGGEIVDLHILLIVGGLDGPEVGMTQTFEMIVLKRRYLVSACEGLGRLAEGYIKELNLNRSLVINLLLGKVTDMH